MERNTIVTYSHNLVTETCCGCGILFAMPNDFQDACIAKSGVDTGKAFYCPNGHQQWYVGKSDAQKLKDAQNQLAKERDNAEFWRSQERKQSELTEKTRRQLSAAKGRVTRIKNRIAAGVCPCCNRSFTPLADHMRTEHPEFTTPE